jgi:catechol 2,3-dioxygenase-like lactoylglutathione lyase family enzyme
MGSANIRYIVDDVAEAIAFYTEKLGFELKANPAPGFAILARDGLTLMLNAPGAGGAGQAMADGEQPRPGGWNRIQLVVQGLEDKVEVLRKAGCTFHNALVKGQGGNQILLQDPSGNLIELFEPFPAPPIA